MCEPPPNEESAAIANALINALPLITSKTDFDKQEAMVKHAYRVSRAVLGDELSNQLELPEMQTAGLLKWMKWSRRLQGMSHKIAPNFAKKRRANYFVFLLEASMLEDLRYRLPDHLETKKAAPW